VTERLSPRRVFAAHLVGFLLVQAAWILTMPTFRGIDEFDHVYKAASVARGQWTSEGQATHGRGGLVKIPTDIVTAASAVCDSYAYTGHDNCHPAKRFGNGQSLVATAASAYNPTYYLIVGTVARPFHGDGADYAMRVTTALICALLLAWSATLVARWARGRWPLIMFSLGCTPVLVYSTSIASPNGLTYAGAALLWAAMMGLVTEVDTRRLALPAVIGCVTMVTTHTTGAMWVALIALVTIVLRPLREWRVIVTRHAPTWSVAALTIVGVTAASFGWVVYANANALGEARNGDPLTVADYLTLHAMWVLQSIAVFPTLNEPPPAVVYALWGVPLLAMVGLLFRFGSHRQRLAAAITFAFLIAVPTALTALSYSREGIAWQGRYSLPLWLGVSGLTGLALSGRLREPRRAVVHVLFAMLAIAVAVSTVHVGRQEAAHGAASPAAAQFPGGFVLVGLLALVGVFVCLLGQGTGDNDTASVDLALSAPAERTPV
jgi:hypothetical protein